MGKNSEISLNEMIVGTTNYTATLLQIVINLKQFVKVEVGKGKRECFPPERGVVMRDVLPG